LFFVLYMLIGVFVMLNMFIAIISDAYAETKEELEKETDMDAAQMGEYVRAYIVEGILYRIPIAGPIIKQVHQRTMQAAEKALQVAAAAGAAAGGVAGGMASKAGGVAGGLGGNRLLAMGKSAAGAAAGAAGSAVSAGSNINGGMASMGAAFQKKAGNLKNNSIKRVQLKSTAKTTPVEDPPSTNTQTTDEQTAPKMAGGVAGIASLAAGKRSPAPGENPPKTTASPTPPDENPPQMTASPSPALDEEPGQPVANAPPPYAAPAAVQPTRSCSSPAAQRSLDSPTAQVEATVVPRRGTVDVDCLPLFSGTSNSDCLPAATEGKALPGTGTAAAPSPPPPISPLVVSGAARVGGVSSFDAVAVLGRLEMLEQQNARLEQQNERVLRAVQHIEQLLLGGGVGANGGLVAGAGAGTANTSASVAEV
jgi:hypothetical protein